MTSSPAVLEQSLVDSCPRAGVVWGRLSLALSPHKRQKKWVPSPGSQSMSKPAEYGQVSPTQPSDQQSAAPHWTGRGARSRGLRERRWAVGAAPGAGRWGGLGHSCFTRVWRGGPESGKGRSHVGRLHLLLAWAPQPAALVSPSGQAPSLKEGPGPVSSGAGWGLRGTAGLRRRRLHSPRAPVRLMAGCSVALQSLHFSFQPGSLCTCAHA